MARLALCPQRAEFIVKALQDYRHGARGSRGNIVVPEIACSLNEDKINALGRCLSRQSGKGKEQ